MSSRIPPSQRDRSNLAAALRQTDRQVRSLSGPGYFGGRLGIPQPVPGSTHLDALLDDDDGDGTEADVDFPVWEDRDRYVLTAADVTRGHFRHQLLHGEIVEGYEFTAYVNGISLDPSCYRLDPVSGVIVLGLGGWEQVGEDFRFHYAYTGGEMQELITSRASTASFDTPVTAPATHEGDNVLLAVALVSGAVHTALNGWGYLGTSDSVTHLGTGGVSLTYRLALYSIVAPAGPLPLPVFTNATLDCPWVMVSTTGGNGIGSTNFDTVADASSASAPVQSDPTLYVWAIISDNQHIDAPGNLMAEHNPPHDPTAQNNVQITIHDTTGGNTATVTGTAGWMVATIAEQV